jgi:prolyl-tRNA synthetase
MFLGRQVVLAFQGTQRVVQRPSSFSLRHLSKAHHQRLIAAINVSTRRERHSIRLCSTATEFSEQQKSDLESQIKAKGDEIRALKDSGADKSMIGPLVEELLALKAQLDPSILDSSPKKQQDQKSMTENSNKQIQQPSDDESESDFITARSVDYSKWYNDIIRVTGLAETSPVRGCMVIKPWGMSLWDTVRTDLDAKIKEHGAENAYFPLLIPKSFLSKEAEHVDGFAKECAVVTHHRLTTGEGGLIADPEAELEDPLIIRPTSETMIWYMFRKWIKSHRYGMLQNFYQRYPFCCF